MKDIRNEWATEPLRMADIALDGDADRTSATSRNATCTPPPPLLRTAALPVRVRCRATRPA
jgi:hypothetical protein